MIQGPGPGGVGIVAGHLGKKKVYVSHTFYNSMKLNFAENEDLVVQRKTQKSIGTEVVLIEF